MKKYPCPSCGFLVFDEPVGSFEICPICTWEDDHVQLHYPCMAGGANGSSLYEYQQAVLKDIRVDDWINQGYQRDPDWRPLVEEDCKIDPGQPQNGVEYFCAVVEDEPPYYWKK